MPGILKEFFSMGNNADCRGICSGEFPGRTGQDKAAAGCFLYDACWDCVAGSNNPLRGELAHNTIPTDFPQKTSERGLFEPEYIPLQSAGYAHSKLSKNFKNYSYI